MRMLKWPWAIWALVAVAVVFVLPQALDCRIVDYDAVVRYAPMSEEFARGNWREVFHPRFGVLFPCLSGLLCWSFPLRGLEAAVIVSVVTWALCIVPLFRIADTIFGRRTAWLVVVLYVICPMTLQHAFKGLREPLRMLGLLLAVRGIYGEMDRQGFWNGFVPTCLGCVTLCLIKIDSIAFAWILWLVYAFAIRFRWRSWTIMATMLVVLQLPCWVVWRWTGYWLPVPQLVRMFS